MLQVDPCTIKRWESRDITDRARAKLKAIEEEGIQQALRRILPSQGDES